MKKLLIGIAAIFSILTLVAGPHGHGGRRGLDPHGGYHHGGHHDSGGWGRGGCNFWPGFVGGLVVGAIAETITTPRCVDAPIVVSQPTVVQPVVSQPVTTTPVITQQPQQPIVINNVIEHRPVCETRNVWVDGRYVDVVKGYGTSVKKWVPGHYETRTVVVQ